MSLSAVNWSISKYTYGPPAELHGGFDVPYMTDAGTRAARLSIQDAKALFEALCSPL
jgi:hypothetical protein